MTLQQFWVAICDYLELAKADAIDNYPDDNHKKEACDEVIRLINTLKGYVTHEHLNTAN